MCGEVEILCASNFTQLHGAISRVAYRATAVAVTVGRRATQKIGSTHKRAQKRVRQREGERDRKLVKAIALKGRLGESKLMFP